MSGLLRGVRRSHQRCGRTAVRAPGRSSGAPAGSIACRDYTGRRGLLQSGPGPTVCTIEARAMELARGDPSANRRSGRPMASTDDVGRGASGARGDPMSRSSAVPARRHRLYFEVRDALGQPGCAAGRLSLGAVSRHLDSLAYENVNDHAVREELRRGAPAGRRDARPLPQPGRRPDGAARRRLDRARLPRPAARAGRSAAGAGARAGRPPRAALVAARLLADAVLSRYPPRSSSARRCRPAWSGVRLLRRG